MQGRETFPIAEGLPSLDRAAVAENGRKVLETRRRRSNRGESTPPPAEIENKKSLPVLKGDRLFDAQELSLEDFELEYFKSESFDEPLLPSEQEEQFRQMQPDPESDFRKPISFEAEIATPERVQIEHVEPGYRTVKQTRRRRGFLRFHKNSEGLGLEIGAEEETDEEHITPPRRNANPIPGPDRRRYFTDNPQSSRGINAANRPEGGYYFAQNRGNSALRSGQSVQSLEEPRRGVLRDQAYESIPGQPHRSILRDQPYSAAPEQQRRGVFRDQPAYAPSQERSSRGVLRESSLVSAPTQEQPKRRGVLREESFTPAQEQPRRGVLRDWPNATRQEQQQNGVPLSPRSTMQEGRHREQPRTRTNNPDSIEYGTVTRFTRERSRRAETSDYHYDPNKAPDISDYDNVSF